MMRAIAFSAAMILLAAVPASAPAASPAAIVVEPGIRQAMEASAEGWNANDIDRFMAVYTDDAQFVTPSGVLEGKAAIAANYRKSFTAGGNLRGKLTFAFLASRPIDAAHQMLFARWTLTGAKVETGMTTLLFEKHGGLWKIAADHSS